MASDFVYQNPPEVIDDYEQYKMMLSRLRSAFPDVRFTLEDVVAENDLLGCLALYEERSINEIRQPTEGSIRRLPLIL